MHNSKANAEVDALLGAAILERAKLYGEHALSIVTPTAHGLIAGKKIGKSGKIYEAEYAKKFHVEVHAGVDTLEKLHAIISDIRNTSLNAAFVCGMPARDGHVIIRQGAYRHSKDGHWRGDIGFIPIPSRILFIDLDVALAVPFGHDWAINLPAAVQASLRLALPPELRTVSCVWWTSATCGLTRTKEGFVAPGIFDKKHLKLRVAYLLSRPITPLEMKTWMQSLDTSSFTPDTSLYSIAQLNYVRRTLFHRRIPDPFKGVRAEGIITAANAKAAVPDDLAEVGKGYVHLGGRNHRTGNFAAPVHDPALAAKSIGLPVYNEGPRVRPWVVAVTRNVLRSSGLLNSGASEHEIVAAVVKQTAQLLYKHRKIIEQNLAASGDPSYVWAKVEAYLASADEFARWYLSQEVGWLNPEPAYPRPTMQHEEARKAVVLAVHQFAERAEAFNIADTKDTGLPMDDFADLTFDDNDNTVNGINDYLPPRQALKASTGLGKTEAVFQLLARMVAAGSLTEAMPALIIFPTLDLCRDAEKRFLAVQQNITGGRDESSVAVVYGRDIDGMCGRIGHVKAAVAAGERVETSCCRAKPNEIGPGDCPILLSGSCGYYRQRERTPAVWFAPQPRLFDYPMWMPSPSMLFIDENFLSAAFLEVREVLPDRITAAAVVVFDKYGLPDDARTDAHNAFRLRFAGLIASAPAGWLQREHVEAQGFTYAAAKFAAKAEWNTRKRGILKPNMDEQTFKTNAERRAPAGARLEGVLEEFANFLNGTNPESGRMEIAVGRPLTQAPATVPPGDAEATPKRMEVRRLKHLSKRFKEVPLFICDATLPDGEILGRVVGSGGVARIETLPAIIAGSPHQTTRMVLSGPIRSGRMENHIHDIAEYIAARVRLLNARRVLVITYMKHEMPLAQAFAKLSRRSKGAVVAVSSKGAPTAVAGWGKLKSCDFVHFGNIAGKDTWKDVDYVAIIGPPQPQPLDIERDAARLTGDPPLNTLRGALVDGVPRSEWYLRRYVGQWRSDGQLVPIRCNYHPDEFVEKMRVVTFAEAAMEQALGRPRGVNRTAQNAVQVDVLGDCPIPVDVDEMLPWSAAERGAVAAMASSGLLICGHRMAVQLYTDCFGSKDIKPLTRVKAAQRAMETVRIPIGAEMLTLPEILHEDAITWAAEKVPREWIAVRLRMKARAAKWTRAWWNPKICRDLALLLRSLTQAKVEFEVLGGATGDAVGERK